MLQVVIDTNVLVAAMRSNRGASFRFLDSVGTNRWRPNLTVAVVLEYEAVLKRNCRQFGLTEQDIDDVLDGLCSQAGLHRLYYTWRPVAADPDDDMIMEAAIASHSDFIVTYNRRDFPESVRFGIRCVTPQELLILLEERR